MVLCSNPCGLWYAHCRMITKDLHKIYIFLRGRLVEREQSVAMTAESIWRWRCLFDRNNRLFLNLQFVTVYSAGQAFQLPCSILFVIPEKQGSCLVELEGISASYINLETWTGLSSVQAIPLGNNIGRTWLDLSRLSQGYGAGGNNQAPISSWQVGIGVLASHHLYCQVKWWIGFVAYY